MRIVKTQKILYNHELRIRLITDNEDAEYVRLVRKLPDCQWSSNLNSWHTNNIQDHVHYLNKVFPALIRFYDISSPSAIPKIMEEKSERKIIISHNTIDNTLTLNYLYDKNLTSFLRSIGGKPKTENLNIFSVQNSSEIITNLKFYLKQHNYSIENLDAPKTGNDTGIVNSIPEKAEEKFREILTSRNYGKRTIDQYILNVKRFLLWSGKNPSLRNEMIRDYIDELSISKNYSRSFQNQQISSIKAFSRFILGKELYRADIPRPKKDCVIPFILTRQEALKIIQIIPNIKHSALISTIYMTGITIAETVSIKPEDIDFEHKQILIPGKNENNSRSIPLPVELMLRIELYMNWYNPKNYLFEGYKGTKYSERSIQKVLKKYVLKAGINNKTTVKTLRHSYAAQLLENGTEMMEVQKLLGHKCRKTTENYARVAKAGIISNSYVDQ
jgi:site-specific recombinase XerD